MGETEKNARTDALAVAMFDLIKAHYLHTPTSGDRVFEALGACAIVVAVTLIGIESPTLRDTARDFFDGALDIVIKDMIKHPPPKIGLA